MVRSLLRKVVRVEDTEIAALLWGCAAFFCLLCGYFIIRPIRDTFGITQGVRSLPRLFGLTFVVMLVASPIFAALVARYPRRRLVPWVLHFFALNLVVFFALLSEIPPGPRIHVSNFFFSWVSVYNLFVVSVTWSLMVDLFRPEQGRRLFGFMIAGGTLGGVCGAFLTERVVVHIGSARLLLLSALLLELEVFCLWRLRRQAEGHVVEADETLTRGGLLEGVRLLLRSRMLLGICAYMLLTTVCASAAYYERGAIVAAAVASEEARTRLFAMMDVYVNGLTLLFQAFAVSRVMAWIGVGWTLCLLPMMYALGFLALGIEPVLFVIIGFEVLRRSTGFGFATPTKQVLFTLVTPEEKYKSKNFIDTAVWRGGDLLGVWVARLLEQARGLSAVAFAVLPLTALWFLVGRRLGREERRMRAAREP